MIGTPLQVSCSANKNANLRVCGVDIFAMLTVFPLGAAAWDGEP
jgi:hypothetical protein